MAVRNNRMSTWQDEGGQRFNHLVHLIYFIFKEKYVILNYFW